MATVVGRSASVLGLVGLAAMAGCGRPSSAPVRPVPRPGATAFRLDQHLGWPYEVRASELMVDGLPVASRPAIADETTWLGQVSLSAGRHAFVLRTTVAFASDLVGGRCTVQLRAMRVFQVGDDAVTIRLDLHERDVTYGFAERVDLGVHMEGAAAVSFDALRREAQAERSCVGRERAEELLCRSELRLAGAKRRGDAAAHACYSPELDSLRSLADVRRRWLDRQRQDPSAPSPAGDAAAMVLLAERRMETLWRQVERCAPYHGLELVASKRTVRGSGCEARAPSGAWERD